MSVTKEDFYAYESVRMLGKFNMVTNAREAADIAGLSMDKYWEVLKNYSSLVEQFGVK